jgi:hypothetical protein
MVDCGAQQILDASLMCQILPSDLPGRQQADYGRLSIVLLTSCMRNAPNCTLDAALALYDLDELNVANMLTEHGEKPPAARATP